ncbi:MAG TPA: lysozyme inhibitor LprI family protein [Rhodopila sp.]|jgi:uncharacterized protein YecT (DUF1311 family)
MKPIISAAAGLTLIMLVCGVPTAQTQQEMTAREGQAFREADKAMNAAYDRLMGKLSPTGQVALREVQRSWLRFRDQECDFETLGSTDGSVHPIVVYNCKARLTRVRTADLLAQVRCPEGDVGCGNQ